jgi:pimeloyl-ACP methyl ester carboxylesterase
MIWVKLGFSGAIAAIAAYSALRWRIAARQTAIETANPPIGNFITVGGARVHYKTSGAGPDIVLIHGASGHLREWEFGLRAALQTRYRVTAFDRPGHGYSDAIANGAQAGVQAAHLRAAADMLGINAPIVLGHSYGGSVALAWALLGARAQMPQNPPRALVLLAAPSLPWPGRLDMWYRTADSRFGRAIAVPLVAGLMPEIYIAKVLDVIFAPQTPPPAYRAQFGAALALRRASLTANTAQINQLLPEITAQAAQYARLDMPVQLVHGDADTIVPLHIHSQPLSALLPRAQLTVLHGVGHMPHHDHLPEVLAAIDRAAAQSGIAD